MITFAGRSYQKNHRRFTNGTPFSTEHDFTNCTDGGYVNLDPFICQLGTEMVGPCVGEFVIGNGRLSSPGRSLYLRHHLHPIDSPHQNTVSVICDCQEETQHRSRWVPLGFLPSAMDGPNGILGEYAQSNRETLQMLFLSDRTKKNRICSMFSSA